VDVTPPVTSASVAGTQRTCGPNTCFVVSATVTLTANEPATTTYRLNGGAWQTYTGPFVVTNEGNNTVDFYSTDLAHNVEAVKTVTFKITKLSTGVLDDFNRPDGGLGANWSGSTSTSSYKIVGNRVDVRTGGDIYWKGASYGATQEAFVTLTKIDWNGYQKLLLKVQGTSSSTSSGAIRIMHEASTHHVIVQTYTPTKGWKTLATFTVMFADGDQFGARALADGTIQVYKNCEPIGPVVDTKPTNGNFFVNKGGRIGLWFHTGPYAEFDDFGGGNGTP
jgi:hypothetical protein